MNYYKKDIRHIKGTTYSFGFIIEDLDQDLESVYFTCRENLNDDSEIIFEKSLEDGISLVEYDVENDIRKYIVRVAPEDTKEIQTGTYYYGLVINVNTDTFPLMRGKFILEQNSRKEE